MKILNNTGWRTDPWGISLDTSFCVDCELWITIT